MTEPTRPADTGPGAAIDPPRDRGIRRRTEGVALTTAMGIDREAFEEAWQAIRETAMTQPKAVFDSLMDLQRDLREVLMGTSSIAPDPSDGRFDDPAWRDSAVYRRVGQAYLAWAQSLDGWLERTGMEGINRERARYVLDVAKDVLAPMNTLLGNPEALRAARRTRGRSLVNGLKNFWDDLRYNHGYPAVADRHGFVVGRDVAASEGAVIYRNELFELIQYKPLTATVSATPLLYVFSQVNRFYLGDLTPDRSLFQRLLERGIPVYAMSWRNPRAEHRDWNLGSYAEGVIHAIDVVRRVQGVARIDVMGVCAGGLTTAAAAGVLAGRGDDWINTLSLFINVLDMRPEDSDFGLFVSERSVEMQKQRVRAKGMYDEKDVFEMFAMLRPEENVMSFFRRNWLAGESPLKHPLLFWSMDYTRVPAGMQTDLLDLGLDNRLAKNEMLILGKRVDLGAIRYPVYLMAGSTDHITPWKACYRSTQLFGGDVTFVLTAQNHTQTISSRMDNRHLRYWIGEQLPADPDAWTAGATEHAGLWVGHWIDWLRAHTAVADQPAPAGYGNERHPPVDPAPGRYVLE